MQERLLPQPAEDRREPSVQERLSPQPAEGRLISVHLAYPVVYAESQRRRASLLQLLGFVAFLLFLSHAARHLITGRWAVPPSADPLRVLFVGGSLIAGAPAKNVSWHPTAPPATNLPQLFELVATSLGETVAVAEDTIGAGCPLAVHRPSLNPLSCAGGPCPDVMQIVDVPRVNASLGSMIPASVSSAAHPKPFAATAQAPCPQLLERQPFGPWDVVVLQEHPTVATSARARALSFLPAVREFSQVLRSLGAAAKHTRPPKLLTMMTWAAHNGTMGGCEGEGAAEGETTGGGCRSPVSDLAHCGVHSDAGNGSGEAEPSPCEAGVPMDWVCESYALARAYDETLSHGADAVIPAGLAWHAARGAPAVPRSCRAVVDAEYATCGVGAGAGGGTLLDRLQPRLTPPEAARQQDRRWAQPAAARALFHQGVDAPVRARERRRGATEGYQPSLLAQYLNACVCFALLFHRSPVGAAWPDGRTAVGGIVLPALAEADALAMQRIAEDVVMMNLDVWAVGGGSVCPPPPSPPPPSPPPPESPPTTNVFFCV